MSMNWWQYGRQIYNIGRTERFSTFADDERVYISEFIEAIQVSRPWIVPRVEQKTFDQLPVDASGNKAPSNESMAKILQVIGRNFKIFPPSNIDKFYCDLLFENTGARKERKTNVNVRVDPKVSPAIEGTSIEKIVSGSVSLGTGAPLVRKGNLIKLVPVCNEPGLVFRGWSDGEVSQERTIEVDESINDLVAEFTQGGVALEDP